MSNLKNTTSSSGQFNECFRLRDGFGDWFFDQYMHAGGETVPRDTEMGIWGRDDRDQIDTTQQRAIVRGCRNAVLRR